MENFGEKMAAIHGERVTEGSEEDKEEVLRRSLRYKGKEDQKVEDLPKIRAEEIDNYGKSVNPSTSNPSLLHMTSLVGIDLGCSIEMIDKNIEVIQKWKLLGEISIGRILLIRIAYLITFPAH